MEKKNLYTEILENLQTGYIDFKKRVIFTRKYDFCGFFIIQKKNSLVGPQCRCIDVNSLKKNQEGFTVQRIEILEKLPFDDEQAPFPEFDENEHFIGYNFEISVNTVENKNKVMDKLKKALFEKEKKISKK